MLISNLSMSKRRMVVVLLVVVAFFVAATGIYYYIDSRNTDGSNPGEVVDEGEALVPEYTEKVSNFETDTVELILSKDITDIEKLIELSTAASLSISVGNYSKALTYQEAAYNLNTGEQEARDILLYEIILSSRNIYDQEREEKYSALLGIDKLNKFDTSRNKDDERE